MGHAENEALARGMERGGGATHVDLPPFPSLPGDGHLQRIVGEISCRVLIEGYGTLPAHL